MLAADLTRNTCSCSSETQVHARPFLEERHTSEALATYSTLSLDRLSIWQAAAPGAATADSSRGPADGF